MEDRNESGDCLPESQPGMKLQVLGVLKNRVLETHIDSLKHSISYGHTKVSCRMKGCVFLKQGEADIGVCV